MFARGAPALPGRLREFPQLCQTPLEALYFRIEKMYKDIGEIKKSTWADDGKSWNKKGDDG